MASLARSARELAKPRPTRWSTISMSFHGRTTLSTTFVAISLFSWTVSANSLLSHLEALSLKEVNQLYCAFLAHKAIVEGININLQAIPYTETRIVPVENDNKKRVTRADRRKIGLPKVLFDDIGDLITKNEEWGSVPEFVVSACRFVLEVHEEDKMDSLLDDTARRFSEKEDEGPKRMTIVFEAPELKDPVYFYVSMMPGLIRRIESMAKDAEMKFADMVRFCASYYYEKVRIRNDYTDMADEIFEEALKHAMAKLQSELKKKMSGMSKPTAGDGAGATDTGRRQ